MAARFSRSFGRPGPGVSLAAASVMSIEILDSAVH
jgi:hypothetical protein